jgi:hypothetical protein
MIRPVEALASISLLLAIIGCGKDAAGPTPPQASAFLWNRSPWRGWLSVTGPTGLIAGLHAEPGDSSCVTLQTAPPDSVTVTARIDVPILPHIRTFRWLFNGGPNPAVELDGDSVGAVISSSIGLVVAPDGCVW